MSNTQLQKPCIETTEVQKKTGTYQVITCRGQLCLLDMQGGEMTLGNSLFMLSQHKHYLRLVKACFTYDKEIKIVISDKLNVFGMLF